MNPIVNTVKVHLPENEHHRERDRLHIEISAPHVMTDDGQEARYVIVVEVDTEQEQDLHLLKEPSPRNEETEMHAQGRHNQDHPGDIHDLPSALGLPYQPAGMPLLMIAVRYRPNSRIGLLHEKERIVGEAIHHLDSPEQDFRMKTITGQAR